MSDSSIGFTTTDLIASASHDLLDGGYQQINGRFPEWGTPTSRLFENEYSIVGLVAFETCGDLLKSWPDVQGTLVDVISHYIGSQESKSWDGYLVLLTPGLVTSKVDAIEVVRYNTTRVRKLVATGDDLKLLADVTRVLRPLLPLQSERADLGLESVLDLLPKLLAADHIPENVTQLLVNAYKKQEPMLEQLHEKQGEK
jgi:hypothetical protein